MENEHLPKNFEKFKVFKDLSKDIALLIKNLENNLKNRLNQNKPSSTTSNDNLSKSALGSRLRKIWPFKGVLEGHRASLSAYLEYKNNLNKFLDEIVLENTGKINLIEQYDQISDIIDKFKLDALNIFTKYSKQLQPEYDKERADYIKRTEVPDSVSDEEIRAAHSNKTTQDANSNNVDENMVVRLITQDVNFYEPDEKDKEQISKIKNIESLSGETFNNLFIKYSPRILKGGKEEILDIINRYKNKIEQQKNHEEKEKIKQEIKPLIVMITKPKNEWPSIESLLSKKANEMNEIEKAQLTLLFNQELISQIGDDMIGEDGK
jgi:hypothetical protein